MQPIFKNATVERLDDELRSGESLKRYFTGSFEYDEDECIINSSVKTDDNKPILLTTNPNLSQQDFENAVKLHKYLPGLSRVQASDKRLWTYLTHVEFFNYCSERWGYAAEWHEIKDDKDEKIEAVKNYRQHWFIGTAARALERNAIARLWWGAHQTFAPWQTLSGNGVEEVSDPYIYTKELFRSQDTFVQIMGRSFFWDRLILISMLEFLRRHPEIGTNELRILLRQMVININLLLGSRKLTFMQFDEIVALFEQIAVDIKTNGE
jgi:hypothetical protein